MPAPPKGSLTWPKTPVSCACDEIIHLIMPYRILNVFCAVPGDLEPEQDALYRATAQVNETHAMKAGTLFAPLSLMPASTDKAKFQHDVDRNIRLSSYFVLVIDATWGPPERNFERDLALARECESDPKLPMQGVVALVKSTSPEAVRTSLGDVQQIEFLDTSDAESKFRSLLVEWLDAPAA